MTLRPLPLYFTLTIYEQRTSTGYRTGLRPKRLREPLRGSGRNARYSTVLHALLRYHSSVDDQVGKGVDTLGGLPPPQAPPEGSRTLHLASPADFKAYFGFGK